MANAHRVERSPAHPPGPSAWWVRDLIVVLLVVCVAFVPFPIGEFRAGTMWQILLVLSPVLLLPLRRRFPLAVVAGTIAVYALSCLLSVLAPGVVFALAVAIAHRSRRSSRRVSVVLALVAMGCVLAFGQLLPRTGVLDPRLLLFAILVAFAAAAGDAARSGDAYVEATLERAQRAERNREAEARRQVVEERLRIARDLHDAVAHQISVISLNAGVASSALESRPERARESLATIRTASRAVLGEIGDLLTMLRSDEGAAVAPPQPGLAHLDALLQRFAWVGLVVTVHIDGDLDRVTGATGSTGYRVVQEGLTNAQKHGSDDRAHLLIEVRDETVRVVVTNAAQENGHGDAELPTSGHGLLGLSERVHAVRGTLSAVRVRGGHRLEAMLPLGTEEAA